MNQEKVNLTPPVTTGLDIIGNDFANPQVVDGLANEPEITPESIEQFKQMLETEAGMDFEKIQRTASDLMQFRHMRNEAEIALEFVNAHKEDYHPTPANSETIQKYLRDNNLPVSRESLEKAFTALTANGELTRPDGTRSPSVDELKKMRPDEMERAIRAELHKRTGKSTSLDRTALKIGVTSVGSVGVSGNDPLSFDGEF